MRAGCATGSGPGGCRPPRGSSRIEIPQVRQATETFASKLFPRTPKLLRTEPLKALVIGAFVRGLSMRDVESLCEQAGLGKLSKSTASRMCEELKERFEAFRRRDLYEIRLVALFLDATFIAVRPDGPKEGVQVAWGFTEDGERVLLAVSLGMRESFEDWQIPRARSDQPRAGGADADRRRRRPRADQGDRAVLARVRPPTLLRAPRPQPLRQAARPRTRTRQARLLASARTRRSANRTPSTDSKRSSMTSTSKGSPPPPAASPTTSTRSSCTFATQSGTADDGDPRTCSSAPSAKSNAAPR